MKKQIIRAAAGAGFIALFLACMSPYSLFQILTGTESATARDAFWHARLQCMSLFIGIMFIVGALRIFVTRRVDPNSVGIHPLNDLEEQEIRSRNRWYRFQIPATFVLTGKRAARYGLVALAIGVLELGLGLHFWVGTFLPTVTQAKESAIGIGPPPRGGGPPTPPDVRIAYPASRLQRSGSVENNKAVAPGE